MKLCSNEWTGNENEKVILKKAKKMNKEKGLS